MIDIVTFDTGGPTMPRFAIPDASGLTPLKLPGGLAADARPSNAELPQPAPKAVARFQAAMAEPATETGRPAPTTTSAVSIEHAEPPILKLLDTPIAKPLDTPIAERQETVPSLAVADIAIGQDIRQTTADSQMQQPTTGNQAQQPTVETQARQPATVTQAQQPTVEAQARQPATETQAQQPTAETQARQPATEAQAQQPMAEIQARQPATENLALQQAGDSQVPAPAERPIAMPSETATPIRALPGNDASTNPPRPVTLGEEQPSCRPVILKPPSAPPIPAVPAAFRPTTDDPPPLQAAPVTVPIAPDIAPVAVAEAVSIEIDPATATARTHELVEAALQVADTILVTPSFVRGEGTITIQLKPTVLDGSEIRLEAKGTEIKVVVAPATHSIAQVVEQSKAQFEQTLAERIPTFQIAVSVEAVRFASRRKAAIV